MIEPMCVANRDDMDSLEVKGIVLTMKDDEQKEDDEMRPEYDFSKLKLVGRGIYAERYRPEYNSSSGMTKIALTRMMTRNKARNAESVQFNSPGQSAQRDALGSTTLLKIAR